MILIGELSLWVALLMAAWAALVSFGGGALKRGELVASGVRAIYATWGLVVLASIGLWTALLRSDFSFKFVWEFTSSNLPAAYKFTAFWGGQAGSLLFWVLILSTCASLALLTSKKTNPDLVPYVSGTLALMLVFFLAVLCLASNPYERIPNFVPAEGRGLNPQLQNPGMAFHPPNLYLGYVSTAIPFAFAVAALITRRLDTEWIVAVRRWALFSWFFLTLGILIGMWWAYVELGWSGYWAWDPVENSSLLPWLTQTAFLHSVMIQEKRGMLRKWNVTLVAASFLLSILGTFITRSGVIDSVHSFAKSEIGLWFLGFLIVAIVLAATLVTTRLKDLEAKAHLESMLSREAAFLYNNVALVGIAFAVLWGTFFPILSEWQSGTKITVGPPFFNAVNVPLGLFLLALTGIGPLIAWRRTSAANLRRQFTGPVVIGFSVGAILYALGMHRPLYALMAYSIGAFVAGTIAQEFQKGTAARMRMYGEKVFSAFTRLIARNRRRYGGYVVHAGIVLLFAAFAGMAFHKDDTVDLAPAAKVAMTDPFGREWTFTNLGVSIYEEPNFSVTEVALATTMNGLDMGVLKSAKRKYFGKDRQPLPEQSTEVGINYSARQDVYVVLSGVSGDQVASLHINFNPLVAWVWLGGALMLVGGMIVMWPSAERTPRQPGYAAALRPEGRPQASTGTV